VTTVLYSGDAIASYKQVTYSDASVTISLFKHVFKTFCLKRKKDND